MKLDVSIVTPAQQLLRKSSLSGLNQHKERYCSESEMSNRRSLSWSKNLM